MPKTNESIHYTIEYIYEFHIILKIRGNPEHLALLLSYLFIANIENVKEGSLY